MTKPKAIIIGIILLICLAFYAWFNFVVSEGYRVGTVVKFSRKGGVIKSMTMLKTWEGTLHLGTQGVNQWDFSVSDPAIIEKVLKAQDTQGNYRLHYKQYLHTLRPQDTAFFVVNVEPVTPE